jgi:hypothetical protein
MATISGLRNGTVQCRFARTILKRETIAAAAGVLALLLGEVTESRAAFVTYNWVPNRGSFGVGSLTFNLPSSIDPADFSSIPLSSLREVQYKFDADAQTFTLSACDIARFLVPRSGFSASNGLLTNTFSFASQVPYSGAVTRFRLHDGGGGPSGNSSNSLRLVSGTAETDTGSWCLAIAAVPIPSSALLLAAGLGGLLTLLRQPSRKHQAP